MSWKLQDEQITWGKITPLKIGCSEYEDVLPCPNYVLKPLVTFTADFPLSAETTTIWNCQHLKYHFLNNIWSVSRIRQSCYIWIAALGKQWKITSLWLNVTRQADWASWAFSKIFCGDPDQTQLMKWRRFKQTASEFLQRNVNCETAVWHSWSYSLLHNFTRNPWYRMMAYIWISEPK